MDVIKAIKTRRSFRRFIQKDIDDKIIFELIEAASFAPSAHNYQPWEFIVARDPEKKQKIAENSTYAKFLTDAPVAIIVCVKPGKIRRVEEEILKYFSIQDSAAAIQNLLLAAHAKGIGTCWIGDLKEELLRDLYNIPKEISPVAIIAVGYPENINPRVPQRKTKEEIIHMETY